MVSTSGKRSRDISIEAILPRVQRARPTMYWLLWLRSLPDHQSDMVIPIDMWPSYFFREFVTSVKTS